MPRITGLEQLKYSNLKTDWSKLEKKLLFAVFNSGNRHFSKLSTGFYQNG
jgi:hypothetical protein